MKKTYAHPEIILNVAIQDDIMVGSDTFIDVGDLWSDE